MAGLRPGCVCTQPYGGPSEGMHMPLRKGTEVSIICHWRRPGPHGNLGRGAQSAYPLAGDIQKPGRVVDNHQERQPALHERPAEPAEHGAQVPLRRQLHPPWRAARAHVQRPDHPQDQRSGLAGRHLRQHPGQCHRKSGQGQEHRRGRQFQHDRGSEKTEHQNGAGQEDSHCSPANEISVISEKDRTDETKGDEHKFVHGHTHNTYYFRMSAIPTREASKPPPMATPKTSSTAAAIP